MAGKEFNVLYTHQKKKKAKVWQDGILKINDQGTKATLLGEGNKRLDQVHLKVNQAAVGEELESEKYLITIEEAVLSSDKPVIPKAASLEKCQQNPPDYRPDSQSVRRLPLKRKRTGFVPPRQINKKPSPEKESPPNAIEIHQLSTSSEFESSRSSLFSTPCNNISFQQGPKILNMYGRNTANTSQSNATSSQLQHGIRNAIGSYPYQQENDRGLDFHEWDDDGTRLSMVHAGQQQGHQPAKNTDIRGTYNNIQDGRELTKPNEFGPDKSSLSANPPSLYQKLPLKRSSEHVGYKKHPALFANAVKPETNADSMETNLSENLWRISSGQDNCKDHSDQLASSVKTLETKLTKVVHDQSDNPGAKRSTSRILALLGKGRKPFQPPLKQKTSKDTDSVSQTYIGRADDPSSQAILGPHRQEHVHQNNNQRSVTSVEPLVKEQTFDEPPSFNTESQKPDMCREFETDLSGKTTSLISTSLHNSIPNENDLIRLNNISDQVNAGSPIEGTVCPETKFYQENPPIQQNQDMKLGVNKRTGLGTDRKVTKNHEVEPSSEIKQGQCKKCQGSRCTCKLANSYHEEEPIMNESCDSNRKILNRVTADPEVVATCSPSEMVDEHSIVQGKEDKNNFQNQAILGINDSEGLGIASTYKSDSNPDILQEEEELDKVSEIDNRDVKSSTSEKSPHFMETEIDLNEPGVPQHSDSYSSASSEENHEKHTSLDLSHNVQATLHAQNKKQRSLTDDISKEPHFTGTCMKNDIVSTDICLGTSCLQDTCENRMDVFQSPPKQPEVQSDVPDGYADKLQRDDAQQSVHSFDDMDTDYEQVSFNSTIDGAQKSTTLAADSDLHVDMDCIKTMKNSEQDHHPSSTLGADVASLTLSSKEDEAKNMIDACQKSPRLEETYDVDNREKDADHGMDHVNIDTDGRTSVSSCDYIRPKDTSAVVKTPRSQETDFDPIDCKKNYISKDAQLNKNPVDISQETICEHDGSKDTRDVFQISSSLEGDFDSIDGKENYWSKDDQLSKNHVVISLETTCEHGSSKGTTDVHVFQNSESSEAGSVDHGLSLLSDKAQNSIHPGNVGLHRSDAKLSEKLQEFQREEHIRKLEMAYHEASSCPTSYDAEPMHPGGSSQQSCGTSIDTLDFSQDTQQNKETTLNLQNIQRGHIQKGSTNHSPVPTNTQNVDAVVPDMDCIKTQHLPESQCGGPCDINEYYLSKKTPSFCDPLVAERSEQSVPEISASRQYDEIALSNPGETDQVHGGGGNVSGDGSSIPVQMVELSAPARERFGKEEDENCDDNTSMYTSMSWSTMENHQQIGTTGNYQSNRDIAIYDNCNNDFQIPSSMQAEGSTPLRQLPNRYDLGQSRCVWNAILDKSRRLSQLSSRGSEEDTRSPVFELPHPEEVCNYASSATQNDQSNNVIYKDKHSSILPHPSYLKTSVRRRAINRSDCGLVCEVKGDSPKEGIYWKQYVSSGKVRRHTQTATQSMFKPRQDLDDYQEMSSDASRGHPYDTPTGRIDRPTPPYDNFATPSQAGIQVNPDWGSFREIVPSEASRMQPYYTPLQRSSRLTKPFENSIRTYPQNPFQTEFQTHSGRSTPLQMPLLYADGSQEYATPASQVIKSESPRENLFSPAQNISCDPSEEHCIASPRTTERQGHFSKKSIGNVRRKHWLPVPSRSGFIEGKPSCDATGMQGSDTRMDHTISNVVFDTGDFQTGQNCNPFTVASLQDFFPTSQSNEYRSCSPTLPSCQSPYDFFEVNESQSRSYQDNGSCRNQLSKSPTTGSLLSVGEPADVMLPEPDIMSLYSTQSAKSCGDAVLERKKYNGCSLYQRESSFDMYNMHVHGEDAMNTGQFGNQSHGREALGTDEQDLGVSQHVSDRPPSISGLDTYDPYVKAGNKHHGWYDETHNTPHNSVYGDSGNVEVLATRSSPKMLSDDGLQIDSHSQQLQNDDQNSNSVVGSNVIEQSDFEVNMERAQTQDFFTTQQDVLVNDCNSPKASPRGHTPLECISISTGPLSMVRPGIIKDAIDNYRRQDGSKVVSLHDVDEDRCPTRNVNISDHVQGNANQLDQTLDQHYVRQSEHEQALNLESVQHGRQLTHEEHEYNTNIDDIITDDDLLSGFHDNQVMTQELEDVAGQASNQIRVGTSQDSLDVGQIALQGNIRGNTSSLHHLHKAYELNGQEEWKSGSQTQPGNTQTKGTGGQERREVKKGFGTPVSSMSSFGLHGELNFPAADTVHSGSIPQRRIMIPVSFPNATSYKQIMTEAVKEHVNILLHELSHRYHSTLEKADITSYTKAHRSGDSPQMASGGGNPPCKHGQPAKMVCVKKDGLNKGRMFYACNNQRENQCKFFVWADQLTSQISNNPSQTTQTRSKITLHNAESIEKFVRTNQIHLYCDSQLSRRGSLNEGVLGSAPAWVKKYRAQQLNNTTKKLYIKLHRKEHSSTYAKDDLWIISKDLTFDPTSSFIAKSMFHGPSSSKEIEIKPLTGYSPSNWSSEDCVYGVLACNASSELTCLDNLQEYVNPRTFPILPHLITCEPDRNPSLNGPAFVKPSRSFQLNLPASQITELVEDTIRLYHLNPDQSAALVQVVSMLAGGNAPVTLIHGVFGAGKSYLLAVMVLLLVKLFQLSEERETRGQEVSGWKVLIASTTNVAVDRILLGLLELGFEDFIRVGSLRKIAKPVLPFSVHASDKENQEMKELQEMLKGDLTLSEKQHVRRSMERQRLGKNKEMLSKVKVIGVTCAACSFPCIKSLTLPVVLLDECSQMMEPSSLLPMARFGCEKLVLVGDPHQLDPTIQGSESAHKSGLEQTLFDRLTLMGYDPIMLRTQYRCHPCISSLANELFYDGQLLDGVIEEDRPPLLPKLPTLCFFNISHGREMSARDGSYYNDPEASFVVFLISSMMEMGISPTDVGVITLYKAQVSRIRMLLQTSSTQNSSDLKAIQISTVDAFQGGEKSIIILSCVRTQRVGFIDSDKRTNVALTRSKNHLLILGGMKMLSDNLLWGEIIHKCQERPDGIQDSKAFQKQWEERLRKLKEDSLNIEEERPKRKKGKRRKLEVMERDHSPAMSLDSNDGDFINISPSVSGTSDGCTPVILDMDSSENTTLHPVGSPKDSAEDDLPCVDLGAHLTDMEITSATSDVDHIDTPHLQEAFSLSEPAVCSVNKSAISPHSSAEEEDLPHIDLGSSSKYKDVGSARSMMQCLQSQDNLIGSPKDKAVADTSDRATDLIVSVEESREPIVQEPMETPETSISYSPLQNVTESDSEESGEELPNFDIGDMFL